MIQKNSKKVSETVYIPQEDSYLLAKEVKKYARGNVLDMGTGSGIQGLYALENKQTKSVLFSDINPKAIEYVKKDITENPKDNVRNVIISYKVSNLYSPRRRGPASAAGTGTVDSKAGLRPVPCQEKRVNHHKVIVIGTGPAGYTAALYTSRANLAPLVFEGVQPGGQLTITTEVENFPGFRKGIDGPALMEEMREQVLRFGTTIKSETVLKADLQSHPFHLTTDKGGYTADAVIIATGASAMWLGIDKDEQLSRSGGGVSACATCDGFFFRGKEIAVVGGGDTAVEEATFLTKFATKVHLIHRRDKLRASKTMQERAFKNEKIQPVWNKVVLDVTSTRRCATRAPRRPRPAP